MEPYRASPIDELSEAGSGKLQSDLSRFCTELKAAQVPTSESLLLGRLIGLGFTFRFMGTYKWGHK